MRFKTIRFPLPWTERDGWLWPAGDKKLIGVFDQVADIEVILPHVPADRRAVCIQAGGACGIWPLRFAQLFESVFTFEPQIDNYECLVANCGGSGVIAQHAALGNDYGTVRVENDVSERDNWGAGYVVPAASGVPTKRIDDLALDACDLICLDVEGAELDALKGGARTIEAFHPVIALEDKPLPHLHRFRRDVGDPERWLAQFGYRVVERIHRDVILAC